MKNNAHETLGNNVIPTHYSIKLDCDMKRFEYDGYVEIEAEVKRPANSISLNAKEIKIIKAGIIKDGKGEIQGIIRPNPKKESFEIKLENNVSGKITLFVKFKGFNADKMHGFYRSSYMHGNKKEHLLTTQFEAADARSAFPCFDEPEFKATFELSLVVDKDLDAISNTPIKKTEKSGNKKLVVFERTPKMSTYLLYIYVGKCEYAEEQLGSLKIRVVTGLGKKEMAKLPLEYAGKFVDFYNRYFNVKYPLKKLDLIAVPDFAAGAMENWGAMAFRETALLADEKSTLAYKQYVANTIAHELAHQWFGDLVTMRWWNDLWLNESFATFMSYKAVENVFPEWKMNLEYFTNVFGAAFGADSLHSTHPISVKVNTPNEIDSIFDEISYEKGGSVLYMIEDYATPEIFRKGLEKYLKMHAYSNATKEDLWSAIENVSKAKKHHAEVKKVATYWIDKEGYPMLKCEGSSTGIRISQSRFTLLGGKENGTWPIPVHMSIDGTAEKTILMKSKSIGINTGYCDWVKLNYGQAGLYKVSYDNRLLLRLGKAINERKINGIDTWGIESDLFSQSRARWITVREYMNFIEDFCMDTCFEFPVNLNIIGHLNALQFFFMNTGLHDKINELIEKYNSKIIEKIGWNKAPYEDSQLTLLRSAAINSLGLAGNAGIVEKAKELFWAFIKQGKEIEPDIRGSVYHIAARTGNEKVYEKFKSLYITEKRPEEKQRFLASLGMFGRRDILENALAFAKTDEVKPQDTFVIPSVISGNPFGNELILQWTKKNWEWLENKFSSGSHMLPRFVDNFSELHGRKIMKEFERFFSKKAEKRKDIERAVKQAKEMLKINTEFLEAN